MSIPHCLLSIIIYNLIVGNHGISIRYTSFIPVGSDDEIYLYNVNNDKFLNN